MAPFVPRGLRKTLALQDKIKILEEIENGTRTKSEIAKFYNMPKSTLSTLIKSKDKILNAYRTGRFNKKQKSLRESAHPKLEDCLVKWLKMVRAKKISVDRKLLKEQAEMYALQLGIENFSASDGWITRFQERKNLTVKRVCGESGDVNKNVTEEWLRDSFQQLTKKYSPSEIYNADETGLFYKALPDKTITFKDDNCTGGKKSKERITLLLAANMDGSDKLPLLVIGKSKNPRCFKGIPSSSMPAVYRNNSNAWMTTEIWEEWLRKLDRNLNCKKRKICLVIDNCSAHGEVSDLKAVELVYLPPNTTSVIQPMDQGVIQALKANYRKALCRRILLSLACDKEYKINLLSAISLVVHEWKNMTPETISNCFRHAGFVQSPILAGENDAPAQSDDPSRAPVEAAEGGSSALQVPVVVRGDKNTDGGQDIISELRCSGFRVSVDVTFEDYVKIDENIETAETLSDEQIVASVLNDENTKADYVHAESEESDAEDHQPELPVRSEELLNAISVLKRFYRVEENSSDILQFLQKIECDVAVRKTRKLVQKTMLDYVV